MYMQNGYRRASVSAGKGEPLFAADQMRDYARAALANQPASTAAPEQVALRRVPTEAMLNAARDWSVNKYGQGIGNDAAIGCWQAMFDAHQPAQEAEPKAEIEAIVRHVLERAGPMESREATIQELARRLA